GSDKVFSVETINTVEPVDNRHVTLRLDQVVPDRIAGLGDIGNANKGAQNFTEVAFRIRNTRDSLQDIFQGVSASKVDTNGTASLNNSTFTAVEHITRDISPVHGYVDLSSIFTAYAGSYDIVDAALQYKIEFFQNGLLNNVVNGQPLTNLLRNKENQSLTFPATGSIALNSSNNTEFATRLLMPYVTSTTNVEMRITFTGVTSGETVAENVRFSVAPVWRRMEYDDNNECIYNRGKDQPLGWNY